MLTTVLVTLCHLVTLDASSKPLTTCFERVAFHLPINVNACGSLMPGIVDWKERGRYAGEEYFIGAVRCVEGNYEPKDN